MDVFPENLPALRVRTQTPPALRYISRLLYHSGCALSLLYVLLLLVQPLLDLQYSRRNDLVGSALSRVQALLKTLGTYCELPPVAVKRDSKYYSDAQVQTATTVFNTPAESRLRDKLNSLKDCVEHYRDHCTQIHEIAPLNFQLRNFQSRIDLYSNTELFKRARGKSVTPEFKQDIRTIKGWYLTGQV